jgi:hypothetical protein
MGEGANTLMDTSEQTSTLTSPGDVPETGLSDARDAATTDVTDRADFAPIEAEETSPDIEAARADIEETRAQMTETIDAIKEKLSPAHLVEEAKESVKAATIGKAEQLAGSVAEKAKDAAATASDALHSAADFVSEKTAPAVEAAKEKIAPAVDTAKTVARKVGATAQDAGGTVVDTIRMNPLPAAVIGFGLGWLALSIRKQQQDNEPNTGKGIYESEAQASTPPYDQFAPENHRSKTDPTGAAIKGAWNSAGNAANNFATSAKHKASDLAVATKEKAQAGYSAVDQWVHENPLAAGAVAVLVGAAVGLAIPATSKENEWMGPKRDELAHKAAEKAHDVVGKVQTVAERAMGTAKNVLGDATQQITTEARNEAQNQGLAAT